MRVSSARNSRPPRLGNNYVGPMNEPEPPDAPIFTAGTVLDTGRLVLRAPEPGDAEQMAVIANDVRVARNLTQSFPHPYSMTDAEAFIGSDPDALAITLPDPDGSTLIGMVGATPRTCDPGMVIFGYWLGYDYWGRGYATEAATAFVDELIAVRRPRRIEAGVYGWNRASGRVLEKLGFKLEGRMRSRVQRFGETTDELVYARVLGD